MNMTDRYYISLAQYNSSVYQVLFRDYITEDPKELRNMGVIIHKYRKIKPLYYIKDSGVSQKISALFSSGHKLKESNHKTRFHLLKEMNVQLKILQSLLNKDIDS